jgi:hypothetical protein
MVLAVAAAGSSFFAASAFAEGYISSDFSIWGSMNNLTPYPLQFVARSGYCSQYQCFGNDFPATLQPGQTVTTQVLPKEVTTGCLQIGREAHYQSWVTYRADVVAGPPEYITMSWAGIYHDASLGCGPYNVVLPSVQVRATTAPPPPDWDPNGGDPAVPGYPGPQVQWVQGDQIFSDATFQIAGNYTVDATTAPPQLVELLDGLCSGASGTTCSFSASGPVQWGIGDAVQSPAFTNCTVSGASARLADDPPLPGDPPLANDWAQVDYTAAYSASLTVGGEVALSTELNLFDAVATEVSVDVEADHEWQSTQSLTRTARIYLPSNNIGWMWVAPTEAKIQGTLVVGTPAATYTITNFAESRSGVTKDALTPAFDVVAKVRKMTPAEIAGCTSKRLAARHVVHMRIPGPAGGTPMRPTAVGHTTPAQPARQRPKSGDLLTGTGVEGIKLGDSQFQVVRRLGQPLVKSPTAIDCQTFDPRCTARAGSEGTWLYRDLSVVWAFDRRVSALIYSGHRRSPEGVGVGSTFAQVRRAFRHEWCTKYAAHSTCKVWSKFRTVKTVFHFYHGKGDLRRCNRVLIFVHRPSDKKAKS